MCIQDIRVGIAEYKTACSPSRIITIGLGSCVGIALYDKASKIGGLAHIMLPDSRQFNNNLNPGKFADLAIPLLLENMLSMGASKWNIVARIGGGASMFDFHDKSLVLDIGRRNISSVKETLGKLSIAIKGEDVGGNQGRTMTLDTGTGRTYIKTVNSKVIEI